MKSEYPYNPTPGSNDEQMDDSGTEAKIDSAFAPAGLKNPFWN